MSGTSHVNDPLTSQPRLDIYHGDNLAVLAGMPDASVDLIYIDPPFNTGHVQSRTQLRTTRDKDGDRVG